ncbi:hypothetical protein BABINDRAFT_161146 [Babjeviella inositovora NRRL Y-12698]|uniref:Phosphatidylinositol 3-kinase VPS34 n=1 Tax=Babjeviella inositovora NRRL Y-12698 TaxID=984486 RepID=A0A1E3QTB0_9ASCO|nr:uncharacterized protein BABINDRAFT_161146 [Babjeviella inositovora NRRL Y-12698]ODQ80167.1 hypothetical protein BABINDRAFT_161146 [Babjeviella inositovora NRRL Y-12698]
MDLKSVTFCLSKDLNIPVLIKLRHLQGSSRLCSASSRALDPQKYQTLSEVSNKSDLFATAQIFSSSKPLTIPVTTPYTSFKQLRTWDQTLSFPINYSQLPFDAELSIRFYEFAANQKSLFGACVLRLFNDDDCTLKRGKQKVRVFRENACLPAEPTSAPNELERMEAKIREYENGDIPPVEWLDNLVFKKLETMAKKSDTFVKPENDYYVFLDMALFDLPIVFTDIKYVTPALPRSVAIAAPHTASFLAYESARPKVFDPDQYREDPIEMKFRKLERSHKDGPLNRELKPTPRIRDELNTILSYSPLQALKTSEKNLLWKFRYYLTRDKRGLTKFLKSINWKDQAEVNQAVGLLSSWCDIEIDDALELLSSNFNNHSVERYAVTRLGRASDHELLLYLLQLVQALNYAETAQNDSLTLNDSVQGQSAFTFIDVNDQDGELPVEPASLSPLAEFLISRAIKNPTLANFFYWYVKVEAEDQRDSIYSLTLERFLEDMKAQKDGKLNLKTLQLQIELFRKLTALCVEVKRSRDTTQRKKEFLQDWLADPKNKMISFAPIPLPLDPTVEICGCYPPDCSVFKSSLSPVKVSFLTTDGKTYPLMFKVGDDLRQDQLVVQIITLMDNLLQNENLDLKLTPYKILATGPTEGAIQFVANTTLDSVLKQYNNGILGYLQYHNPDPEEPLGVRRAAMDNYVKSCAGYCVITYILGVGDRHLDNLLICPTGHFFHADFGYILGSDPKPFPPLMKLPIQIVDGMGGTNSENYKIFKNYCFTTYTTLRKNLNLILNLFQLMKGANIPDIQVEPERAVLKVKEKFALELTEEEAILHFQNLINESVNAFLPVVIDRLHSLAQYWRA